MASAQKVSYPAELVQKVLYLSVLAWKVPYLSALINTAMATKMLKGKCYVGMLEIMAEIEIDTEYDQLGVVDYLILTIKE